MRSETTKMQTRGMQTRGRASKKTAAPAAAAAAKKKTKKASIRPSAPTTAPTTAPAVAAATTPTAAPAPPADPSLFDPPCRSPSHLSPQLQSCIAIELAVMNLRRNAPKTSALDFFTTIAPRCDLDAAAAIARTKPTPAAAASPPDFRLGYYRAAHVVLHLSERDVRRAAIDIRDVHKRLSKWAAAVAAPPHFVTWLNSPANKSARRRTDHHLMFDLK